MALAAAARAAFAGEGEGGIIAGFLGNRRCI